MNVGWRGSSYGRAGGVSKKHLGWRPTFSEAIVSKAFLVKIIPRIKKRVGARVLRVKSDTSDEDEDLFLASEAF